MSRSSFLFTSIMIATRIMNYFEVGDINKPYLEIKRYLCNNNCIKPDLKDLALRFRKHFES